MKEIEEPILRKQTNVGGIEKIINIVFENNCINWGRLVSVLTFCAMKAHLNKSRPNYLIKLEHDFADALLINTGAWFDSHNGWRGFESFMANRKQKQINCINLGLMITFSMILFYYIWIR